MFQLTPYTIRSHRLPSAFDGFRIVHLSDLHGAEYGEGNHLLIEEILRAKPNLIAMTGDMADQHQDSIPRLINLCSRLCPHFPVFLIPGNHEQSLDKPVYHRLMADLKQEGVILLENKRYTISRKDASFSWKDASISRKDASLDLYGLVTPMVYYKDPLGEYRKGAHFSREDTEQALGKNDPSRFCILLAHNPLYYPSYRDWGADLTLSGHIHGGIIRIPGLGGLLSPDLSIFPKYDGGYFYEEGRHLVISRGLGNNFLFRVNNPPELVVITLSRE